MVDLEDIIKDPVRTTMQHISDEEFEQYAEQILAAIVQHPYVGFNAGKYWSDENFNKYTEQIIESLTKDMGACYSAGISWPDNRFDRYAQQIVTALTQNPKWSGDAGTVWLDSRFYPFAEQLMAAVQTDDNTLGEAIKNWRTDRVLSLMYPSLLDYRRSIEPQYRSTFSKFLIQTGTHMIQLPMQEFYLAAEAYEFAKQANKEEQFFKGLKGSAEKGSVGKWAKTIIKYFRESSKGAGNYRMLEVAA